MTTVFLKSMVRPCPSVILPSSSIWEQDVEYLWMRLLYLIKQDDAIRMVVGQLQLVVRLHRSRRTQGVRRLIGRRCVFPCTRSCQSASWRFASSNKNSASDLARCVLPTPVGPIKRKEPSGRSGSPSPTRARRIALETALTASSCPITCSLQTFFHVD